MNTIQTLYDRLKTSGAFLPEGATDTLIEVVNEDLTAENYPPIPPDYSHFLTRANGAQSAAFILLGTEPMPLAGDQEEPDIFEATAAAFDNGFIDNGVVLGRAPGNLLLVFQPDRKKYVLIDAASTDILYEFPDISAFVQEWLDRKKL
jgi:hypothetical protein